MLQPGGEFRHSKIFDYFGELPLPALVPRCA